MKHLLSKTLVIFSGKGGVGKSTLAAAFAIFASRRGKKPLLIEIDPRSTIPSLFERKDVPEYQEVTIHPGISYINIPPLMALEEYIVMKLGFRRLYERLFRSRIYQVFVQASPGLKEIVTLGKIWDLAQKAHTGQEGGRDLLILDAPATGHAIPFLKVPGVVISALRIGPVVREAVKIRAFLSDTKKTALAIITIPEEMAVNEALEMWERTRKGDIVPADTLIVNEVLPGSLSPGDSRLLRKIPGTVPHAPLLRELGFLMKRMESQRRHIRRLRTVIPKKKTYEIPFLFSSAFGEDELREISAVMEGGP